MSRPDDGFLQRLSALGGMPNQHVWMRLLDAYALEPLAWPCMRSIDMVPAGEWQRKLQNNDGSIHWIRPGGMGDWVVLAPFIRALRERRHSEGDTLWVTQGAYALAKAFHREDGVIVRMATASNLLRFGRPRLVLQLEPFHPTAWIWAAMLRPDAGWGYMPGNPRLLGGPPIRSMDSDLRCFHPGIEPVFPPRTMAGRERILVFQSGTHPSRALPHSVAALLRDRGERDVCWFGPLPLQEKPKGWEWVRSPMPPDELLRLIQGAKGLLSPDSGPFHLGRLYQTPTVGYFTSGEVARWGWPTKTSSVVVTSSNCHGCIKVSLPAPCPYSFGCIQIGDGPRLIESLFELML